MRCKSEKQQSQDQTSDSRGKLNPPELMAWDSFGLILQTFLGSQ